LINPGEGDGERALRSMTLLDGDGGMVWAVGQHGSKWNT